MIITEINNYKIVEVELPYYSEISYDKKGVVKYDLVKNKSMFKLKFNKDVPQSFIEQVILLWIMNSTNIENRIIHPKTGDKNNIFAERTFFAKDIQIYNTIFDKDYVEEEKTRLFYISMLFETMTNYDMKNRILDEQKLCNINILQDNGNKTKEMLELFFNGIIFSKDNKFGYNFTKNSNIELSKYLKDFMGNMFKYDIHAMYIEKKTNLFYFVKDIFSLSEFNNKFNMCIPTKVVDTVNKQIFEDITSLDSFSKEVNNLFSLLYEKYITCYNPEEKRYEELKIRNNLSFEYSQDFIEKINNHFLNRKTIMINLLEKHLDKYISKDLNFYRNFPKQDIVDKYSKYFDSEYEKLNLSADNLKPSI